MKSIIAALISLTFLYPLAHTTSAHPVKNPHQELVKKLTPSFTKEKIEKIFSDSRIRLDRSVLPAKPDPQKKQKTREELQREFVSDGSIERGLQYLLLNKDMLFKAQNAYNIDPFTIVALLRIETNFGAFTREDSLIINTLYSLYVLMPQWRSFAVRELTCFLKSAEREGWDIFSIGGSNRGAFGYPQFIPCSFEPFAADGDGDGKINLFSDADAIMSVASYLSKNDWSDRWQNQHRAILRYNQDSAYRDFILEYREKLMRIYFSSAP